MLEKNHAFAKAYVALYQDLRNGRFPPGTKIQAADLVSELGISATPVREALSRLAGQGMLIDRPAIGYFVPAIDPVDLQHFYTLASMLALSACRNFTLVWPDEQDYSAQAALHYRGAGELVRTIALLTPNHALQHVAFGIDDRLARLIETEMALFQAADQSQGVLKEWLETENPRLCANNIRRFYKRRIRAVMDIAVTANASLGGPDNIFRI